MYCIMKGKHAQKFGTYRICFKILIQFLFNISVFRTRHPTDGELLRDQRVGKRIAHYKFF